MPKIKPNPVLKILGYEQKILMRAGVYFIGDILTRELNKTIHIMLPLFYQTLLQKYLTKLQLITLKMLVWLLQHQ